MSEHSSATLEEQIQSVLDGYRPTLYMDGGDVQLLHVDEKGIAHIRMLGACIDCPVSLLTMKLGIQRLLKEHFSEIRGINAITDLDISALYQPRPIGSTEAQDAAGENASVPIHITPSTNGTQGVAMPNPFGAPEISVQDVERKVEAGERFVWLDVREDNELNAASIDNDLVEHVPMSRLAQQQAAALPTSAQAQDAEIVVFCHHGTRSAQVVAWLRGQGWTNALSMEGGIDQWAKQIDPTVGTY